MKTPSEIQNILNHLLQAPGESEVFEFKHARDNFSFKDLCKYFSAIATSRCPSTTYRTRTG